MSWWSWVVEISGTDSPKAMQAQTGIDSPNFSKWKAGQVPRAETVAKFARGYGVPVLEAFVAAGFLSEEEARVRPAARQSLSSLDEVDLIKEVLRRAEERGDADVYRDAPSIGEIPAWSLTTSNGVEVQVFGVGEGAKIEGLGIARLPDRAEVVKALEVAHKVAAESNDIHEDVAARASTE